MYFVKVSLLQFFYLPASNSQHAHRSKPYPSDFCQLPVLHVRTQELGRKNGDGMGQGSGAGCLGKPCGPWAGGTCGQTSSQVRRERAKEGKSPAGEMASAARSAETRAAWVRLRTSVGEGRAEWGQQEEGRGVDTGRATDHTLLTGNKAGPTEVVFKQLRLPYVG